MFLTTSNELSPQLFFPGNCCNVFARSIGFVQHTAMALATQAFGIDVQFGSLIFCNGALRRFFTLLLLLFEEEEEGEALFVVSPLLSVEEYFFPNGMRGSRPPLNALEEEAEDLTDMISPSLSLSVCVCVLRVSEILSSPLLCLRLLPGVKFCSMYKYVHEWGRSTSKEREYAEKRNIPPSKARRR
jgi:hypothetical protein|tara:strand:+ start:1878 stop:2435 length:558 start_codon:yes stop_codon:yes gene_type:complete